MIYYQILTTDVKRTVWLLVRRINVLNWTRRVKVFFSAIIVIIMMMMMMMTMAYMFQRCINLVSDSLSIVISTVN